MDYDKLTKQEVVTEVIAGLAIIVICGGMAYWFFTTWAERAGLLMHIG